MAQFHSDASYDRGLRRRRRRQNLKAGRARAELPIDGSDRRNSAPVALSGAEALSARSVPFCSVLLLVLLRFDLMKNKTATCSLRLMCTEIARPVVVGGCDCCAGLDCSDRKIVSLYSLSAPFALCRGRAGRV